jgi:hypothetical protein
MAIIGGGFLLVGILLVIGARSKAKHAAWLRTNGIPLTARIIHAERTGASTNDVPVYQFALQVAGPRGPYAATFDKLAPEHQVAMLIGEEVWVRANPANLQEVIPED